MSAERFTEDQLLVVAWAAKECRRQRSGEVSVYWMIKAWNEAIVLDATGHRPTEADILGLGFIVEPEVNANGYRRVNVRVGQDVKGPWQDVPRRMANLLGAVDVIDAGAWFYEYEDIHPFRDGNGRTGAILFNWLAGSLAMPVEPPERWGEREEVRV